LTAGLALCATAAFALADLVNMQLTRSAGLLCTLVWVLVIGFVLTVAVSLALNGPPTGPELVPVARAAGAGVLTVGALGCLFKGLRVGRLAIVAPIVALDGAFAVFAALVFGERIELLQGVALVTAVGGGVLAAVHRPGRPPGGDDSPGRHSAGRNSPGRLGLDPAVGWALLSACCFAASYLLYGQASGRLPVVTWVAVSLGAALAVALPAASMGSRLRPPRGAWPRLLTSGVLETCGMLAMVAALTRGPLPVAAVLLAQVATLGALFGALVLREPLARHQWLGVALTVIAATVLAGA
jgi:drug/metabolite transporter (DMT)-like permease